MNVHRPPARQLAAIILLTLLAACAPADSPPPAEPWPDGTPRLVLFLVVDQLSQEYLERFRPVLNGGLAYLLEQGAVFTNAHHDHANTVTGAGHATLASGCFPRRSGIISNSWYDRTTGDEVYCVQGESYRRSPANLLVSTLGDWLKDRDPRAKVFSASGKDRSAVLLGGHQADAALWYGDGDWVTTGYYDEPAWLEDFNDTKYLDRYFGTLWEPLPLPDEVLDELDIERLDEGIYQRDFPYAFGSKTLAPNDAFYDSILSSPFSDEYLRELAERLIEAEQLGADAHPDFLGLGFHALDYVGHNFGPNSREVLDTVMRLDRTLAELFAFVDQRIGLDNVAITLSGDHGVAPLPAYRSATGEWARRTDMRDLACFQQVGVTLKERYGDYEWLQAGLYLNDEAIAASAIDRRVLENDIVALLGACEAVERVWTKSELIELATAPTTDASPSGRLFANSHHPERSADFEIEYAPFYLNRASRGTTHGSPHRYDTWVPMIVAAPGVAARSIADRVRTVDLAPTLADLMGLAAQGEIDGTNLAGLLRD